MKKFLLILLTAVIMLVSASGAWAVLSISGFCPDGTVGRSYSTTLGASYFPYSSGFSWSISGSLPDGLHLNYSTTAAVRITGTPTRAGTYLFTVRVKASHSGKYDEGSGMFAIIINEADKGGSDSGGGGTTEELSISGYLNGGKVGASMPENVYGTLIGVLKAKGGTEPYTWTITKGNLPKGLSLSCQNMGVAGANTKTGRTAVLKGVPITAGTFDFTLKLTDSKGKSVTKNCSVEVKGSGSINDKMEIQYGEFFQDQAYYEVKPFIIVSGGREPYSWTVDEGKLPDGCRIYVSPSETKKCNMEGYCIYNGTYKFVIKATDADGRSVKKDFKVTFSGKYFGNDPAANGNQNLVLAPIPKIKGEFTNVTAGNTYSSYVRVDSGTAPYKWEIVKNDSIPSDLPKGIKLTASNSAADKGSGLTGKYAYLSGVPSTDGFYNFTLKVTDAKGNTDAKAFSVKVSPEVPQAPRISNAPGNAVINKAYKFKFTASGKTPVTYSLTKGSLPAGLTLSTAGAITGKPTKSGTFSFTVKASNTVGNTSKNVKLVVLTPPKITTAKLPDATIKKKYSTSLKVSGSKPMKFTVKGLPKGLKFNSKTLKISGKPSAAKTYNVKITVSNSAGKAAKSLKLVVNQVKPKLTGSLASGKVNKSYSSSLKLSKGTKPVTWSITGKLPKGLKFNKKTGKITGKPSEVWDKKITITAKNKAGKASKTVRLKITEKNLAKKSTVNTAKTQQVNTSVIREPDEQKVFIAAAQLVNNSEPVILQQVVNIPATHDFDESEYVIVCELPEIKASESGLHDFTAELSGDIDPGEKLIWLACPQDAEPSEDDEIAEFYDYDSGDEIDSVPESLKINISAWLTEGVTYKPAIGVIIK